jgi:hypothetical protein
MTDDALPLNKVDCDCEAKINMNGPWKDLGYSYRNTGK